MKRALLLDLDGTLLDTAPDLAGALNALLMEEGREPLPFERIRPHVSHGANRLVTLGFGAVEGAERERLYKRLLDIYRDALAHKTCLFEGFKELLESLTARNMRWGIVTNKPAWLTEPLLETLGICAHCVVSGDTLAERKPHPLPLLHAAELLKLTPADCIYVGDAERDIQAARAAGMQSLVALWGYLSEDDMPHVWQADGMVTSPAELGAWLGV